MIDSVEQLAATPGPAVRRDPMSILTDQDTSRLADLVPVRHDRMSATPFTFYRGAAAVMASDLSLTPDSGIVTQLCGDAHLSNFGLFFSPERRLVFDVNDFDETHPGPFEWDVKRLAASLVVAAQGNGFHTRDVRRVAARAAKEYRKTMVASAKQSALACWYDHVNADDVLAGLDGRLDTAATKSTRKNLAKARHRDSNQALAKLADVDAAGVRLKSDPPLLKPASEVLTAMTPTDITVEFEKYFARYRDSLSDPVATLFDQFGFIDAARKVVGVGSVGTRCWIALFGGRTIAEPFLLQLKEAQRSVLAPYVEGPTFAHHGRRVVYGQQLMQASSDIFLGWLTAPNFDGVDTDFYVRQLRDGKGSAVIEAMPPESMLLYAELCGKVLAQAHARSAARPQIAEFTGSFGKRFDAAIADFAVAYSSINVDDHQRLLDQIASGKVSSTPLD